MKKELFDKIRLISSTIVTLILLILHIVLNDVLINSISINYLIFLPISILFYLLISYDLFIKSFKDISRKQFFNETTLTLIASIAAFCIGEFVEGLAVTVFFQIGEKFEDYAVNKSRDSIKSIIDLRPDKVTLYNEGKEEIKEPFDINVGDLFIVKNGERVPIDGIVIKGTSSLDTSSMTGESAPRKVKEGEEIISGVINIGSPLIIKATKEFYNSTMSKMLDLVENASSNKAKTEKFITTFSKFYTPIVITLAFLIAIFPPLFIGINDFSVWSTYIKAGASFLVISCPCALVLTVPMSYFVSLGQASKHKVLIKGSNYLDKFKNITTVVFDKTGTITKGNFVVDEINPSNGFTKDELLNLVRYGEYYSKHPIASAILKNERETLNQSLLKNYTDISGKGISVLYKDKLLLVGNDKLLKDNGIEFSELDTPFTLIYCAYDNKFIGSLTIRDTIKEGSKKAIQNLYKNGIKNTYMLTGDNEKIAKKVCEEASITNYKANLLPLEKVNFLKQIKENSKGLVAYVGDGINDAPSLSIADLGISMGINGSDLTIESSDAVVMDDDLNKVNTVIKISKKNNIVAYENIIFAILIKVVVMILSLIPNLPISPYIMWFAIFADVGVTIICVCNSLRLSMKKYVD